MVIIRFLTGSVVGMMTGVVLILAVIMVGLSAALLALATTGGAGACAPGGGPITISAANSGAFQQKWDAFEDTLNGGSPATVSLNESEISSRAQTYFDQHDASIDDVRACVHDGFGEGTGKVSLLGFDVRFSVRGTLDLSGAHPEAKIDDIEVGNVPVFVTGAIEGVVTGVIDDQLDDIDLDHEYTPTLREGVADVAGR